MALALLTLIYLLFDSCHSGGSGSWGYTDKGANTSHWVNDHKECGGSRQSGIDVTTTNDQCSAPLTLDWVSESLHFVIRNNGRSLKALPFIIDHSGGAEISELEILDHTNDTMVRLTNLFYDTYSSPVHKEYCFDSLHFHWGVNDGAGSEHALNGEQYPLELHLVHYSCDYKNIGDALHDYLYGNMSATYDDSNILAVIGVLFEIGAHNELLQKILDEVINHNIDVFHDPESPMHIEHILELYYTEFDMMDLLPSNKEIVSYLGSLTTPPCLETVRWHVMKNPMTVSESQMAIFRSMLTSRNLNDTMAPNWRPLQPLNDRTLYECIDQIDDEKVIKDQVSINNVDEAEEESLSITEDNTWQIIAIVFICLFTASLLVIAGLVTKGYAQNKGNLETANKRTAKYQQARSVESEAGDLNNTNNYH